MEDLLAGNGNFTVLDRSTVTDVLTEQDLSRLADVADPGTALPEGKLLAAQALVVGKIAEVDLKAERIEKRYPVFAKDNKGRIRRNRNGQPIVVREEVRNYFHHRGTVRGSVRVIDVATNKVIHSYTAQPISYDDEQQGAPPSSSPEDLAVEAAKALAIDCYNHVAPINREVKLKSDMLVVALDYYDGEYDETKKVPTTLDHFMVAVRKLPAECDRNPFRIAIAPEEGRNLWEQEFVWSTNNSVRGEFWEVPLEPLKATGQEKIRRQALRRRRRRTHHRPRFQTGTAGREKLGKGGQGLRRPNVRPVRDRSTIHRLQPVPHSAQPTKDRPYTWPRVPSLHAVRHPTIASRPTTGAFGTSRGSSQTAAWIGSA